MAKTEKSEIVSEPIAKIVSKEEAFWSDAKQNVANQIEGLEKALKFNKVILEAVLIKLKEAQKEPAGIQ